MNITSIFQAKLRTEKGQQLNTTGDKVDTKKTLIIDKSRAQMVQDEQGEDVLVYKLDSQNHLMIPKKDFAQVDESYYLPSYKPSTFSGLLSSSLQGFAALGPVGLAGGVCSTLVGQQVKNKWSKLALSSVSAAGIGLLGSQLLSAGNPAMFALGGLAVGSISAGSASGKAITRDATLGGTSTGLLASSLTGNPSFILTNTAASAIAGHFNSLTTQMAVSCVAGATLQALSSTLAGGMNSRDILVGAIAGGVAPLIGRGVGQATRNTASRVESSLVKGMTRLPRPVLKTAASLPYALLGATLSSAAHGVASALRLPMPVGLLTASLAGAALGQAVGMIKSA